MSGTDGMRAITPTFDVNCHWLFKEWPLLDRPAAAADAGFAAIEYWWPFETATPADDDIAKFVAAVRRAGVQLVGLNLFAGDLFGPDCGLVSVPSRQDEFLAGVEVALAIGSELGVRNFNALYGNRDPSVSPHDQDALAKDNLAMLTERFGRIGANILIEPISGPKPYPLRTTEDVMGIVAPLARHVANVGVQFDLYHLLTNGDDVGSAIERHVDRIKHVQIADVPGRGEPGSGSAPVVEYVDSLRAAGYSGWVGLEYQPSGSTLDSLAWLRREG